MLCLLRNFDYLLRAPTLGMLLYRQMSGRLVCCSKKQDKMHVAQAAQFSPQIAQKFADGIR